MPASIPTTFAQEVISDLTEVESELGNASFVWTDGNTYSCTASVADVEQELEFGGFKTSKILSMTVRLLDNDGNVIFTSGIPQSQDKITYNVDNLQYRVITVKKHSTGAFIRLMCEGITRGV